MVKIMMLLVYENSFMMRTLTPFHSVWDVGYIFKSFEFVCLLATLRDSYKNYIIICVIEPFGIMADVAPTAITGK